MYTVKVWTAGHRLGLVETANIEIVEETVLEWEKRLNDKMVKLETVGSLLLVKEICIDVLRDGIIFAQYSFKYSGD